MGPRDLLVVDTDSLSAAQAKQIAWDVIDALTRGVPAEDQGQLRSLFIAAREIATGRKVGDSQDTIRAEVLQKIQRARHTATNARSIRISLTQLANMSGNPMTLAELWESEKAGNSLREWVFAVRCAVD